MIRTIDQVSTKEKLKVYKECLRIFEDIQNDNIHITTHSYKYTGLCYPINCAMKKFNIYTVYQSTFPPEIKKFKPKNKWKQQDCFWWSPKSLSGYNKRLEVLKHLASGDWIKETNK